MLRQTHDSMDGFPVFPFVWSVGKIADPQHRLVWSRLQPLHDGCGVEVEDGEEERCEQIVVSFTRKANAAPGKRDAVVGQRRSINGRKPSRVCV